MQKSRPEAKIKKLPKSPGAYIFYGLKREILYVGKATSLRDRVRSYFVKFSPFGKGPLRRIEDEARGLKGDSKNLDSLKIPLSFGSPRYSFGGAGHLPFLRGEKFERPVDYAISQITDIKIIPTDTVLEAYILEQNLIKKLQPKYNAMGKDDKSFAYVALTKEGWPRFVILRKTELDKISNSPNYLISNQILNPKLQSPHPALCATLSPKGARGVLCDRKIQNTKYQIRHTKIFGPYTSRKNIEIVLKLLKRIFPYHSSAENSEKGCLDFELGRCPGPYAGAITRADYLKNIQGIRMILEGKKKGLIKKINKEMKNYSKLHEYEKAAEARNKLFALKHIRDVALISDNNRPLPTSILPSGRGGGILDTRYKIQNTRIEAYDISNISGDYAVGSMVVFNDNEPDKSQYRKFKIKSVKGADDVGMMREILIRRFRNDWLEPDLILLDGGVGHLNMAVKLLAELKLNIPIAAVAKGATRKISNAKFLISNQIPRLPSTSPQANGGQANPNSQDLFYKILNDKRVIKQIMDEAHRFAISYHRKVRKNDFIKS